MLNSRYVANFQPPPKEAYITLTATNAAAFELNNRSLANLHGKSYFFPAQIVGDFPASSYPTEEKLEFKRGAQVMFIKNDSQAEKQFFNGKIGQIVDIDEESITVRCEGDAHAIRVVPAEWKNVKYALNETTKEIEEQVLGQFVQYPLKLAWAITIHKSQGLTFERAIIDAQAAFAHGQVYVALSRCKSFEGIVLRSKIEHGSVKTDPIVRDYSSEAERNAPTESQVSQAKRLYQQRLIEDLFSFEAIKRSLIRLRRLYQENQASLTAEAFRQMSELERESYETLTAIANKFHPQLLAYFEQECMPESHPVLRERIVKAVNYFTEKLAGLFHKLSAIPKQSDNHSIRQMVHLQSQELHRQLFVKQASFAACQKGFSNVAYKRAQFDAELDFQNQFTQQAQEDTVPEGVPNPKLYSQLLEYRQQMAEKYGITTRAVLTSESLRQLVTLLPTSQVAIRKIHGIASKRLQRYGQAIELIIQQYCEANQILSSQASNDNLLTVASGSGTKQTSLAMFQAGKSVEQIAAERRLGVSTIQGHLARYVEERQLDIHLLLSASKLEEIEQYCLANPDATPGDVKTHFGSKFGYGELRLAFSHRSSRQNS